MVGLLYTSAQITQREPASQALIHAWSIQQDWHIHLGYQALFYLKIWLCGSIMTLQWENAWTYHSQFHMGPELSKQLSD